MEELPGSKAPIVAFLGWLALGAAFCAELLGMFAHAKPLMVASLAAGALTTVFPVTAGLWGAYDISRGRSGAYTALIMSAVHLAAAVFLFVVVLAIISIRR